MKREFIDVVMAIRSIVPEKYVKRYDCLIKHTNFKPPELAQEGWFLLGEIVSEQVGYPEPKDDAPWRAKAVAILMDTTEDSVFRQWQRASNQEPT